MNGVHDMGGMHGFGPLEIEHNEPVFHHKWEGVVRAMMARTNGRYYNLDEFRHAIERMPAEDYLKASYYERWLHAVETLLNEKGVITTGNTAPTIERHKAPAITPHFQPGDRVVTHNMHPHGHTRLPRYARGRRGTVRKVYGPFQLPDANAHGDHDRWEPCYAVEFEARELWGAEAGARDRVCIDLWESYLE
ncbi:MAG TPA: nitrile hydratase subunit beta [Candidatus Dormibacteraeota bacterium]